MARLTKSRAPCSPSTFVIASASNVCGKLSVVLSARGTIEMPLFTMRAQLSRSSFQLLGSDIP